MNNFYVYIYLDPREQGQYKYNEYEFDYEPFYVGKGNGRRWKQKKNDQCENKINKIKRLGFETIRIKLKENLEETNALVLEKELIELIGKEKLKEGPLTNETDGGEGVSGLICREETRVKLRKNFKYIIKKFEKRGYKLLTKEKDYENNRQKLEYIHLNCGNKHSISWNKFKQSRGCPICGMCSSLKKRRKNFQEIKEMFEKRKYILLTKENEYKNNKQKLEYIHIKCEKKHSIRFNNFNSGQGCPYCHKDMSSKNRRKNFQDIKNEFEKRKYILLTKEKDYENSKKKLECICNKCRKEYSISWDNFQHGHNCRCRTREKRIERKINIESKE